MWLKSEIKHLYAKLNNLERKKYNLNDVDFSTWWQFDAQVKSIVTKKLETKRARLNKKFRKLIQDQNPSRNTHVKLKPELIPDIVVNKSEQIFNENEKDLLNRGLNFCIPPIAPPIEDIMQMLKQHLNRLIKPWFQMLSGTR